MSHGRCAYDTWGVSARVGRREVAGPRPIGHTITLVASLQAALGARTRGREALALHAATSAWHEKAVVEISGQLSNLREEVERLLELRSD
jgi:hypothetical protein